MSATVPITCARCLLVHDSDAQDPHRFGCCPACFANMGLGERARVATERSGLNVFDRATLDLKAAVAGLELARTDKRQTPETERRVRRSMESLQYCAAKLAHVHRELGAFAERRGGAL